MVIIKVFKGGIFDLDGTLLDSMGIWAEIDAAFLKKRGIDVMDDYIQAVSSMGFTDAAAYTIQRFGFRESPTEMIAEWNQMSAEAYRNTIRLKPNAESYLLTLKKRGIKLAVATALPPELFIPTLKNNGIYHLFDAFTSLNEVERGKGFPDIYLLAAQRLDLLPFECMVFEDIYLGICGAKQGGFLTCGVYDPYSVHEKAKIMAKTDQYIFDFQELVPIESQSMI